MGNCALSSSNHNQKQFDSSYQVIGRRLIYEWNDEIKATLKHVLCKQYQLPHQLFVLFLSYIDKEYKIYSLDPDSTITDYPICIPSDLMTYPVSIANSPSRGNKNTSTAANNINSNNTNSISNFNSSFIHGYSTVDHRINLALHGVGGVGKTSIILKHYTSKFIEDYDPTLEDLDTYKKKIVIDEKEVSLGIKDTAMHQEFVDCNYNDDSYSYKDKWWITSTHVHLLVFAINELNTFNDIDKYFNKIARAIDMYQCDNDNDDDPDPVPMILVGNKSDLEDEYCVSMDVAIEYAKQKRMPFIQTSAKDKGNIDLLFQLATRYVFKCRDMIVGKCVKS